MLEQKLHSQRFALAVFDMAGTTVRDQGEVPAAFGAALNEFGIAVTTEQIAAVRGASKRQALRSLLAPRNAALADIIYDRFVEILTHSYRTRGVSAIDGAAETFVILRKMGIAIALNTGFDRMIADLLLVSLDWHRSNFAAVICSDDVNNGRPAPDLILAAMAEAQVRDPGDVINVGDTVLDMEAGRNAGVGVNVGVLTGASTRAQLQAAPCTCVVDSIRNLPGILQ